MESHDPFLHIYVDKLHNYKLASSEDSIWLTKIPNSEFLETFLFLSRYNNLYRTTEEIQSGELQWPFWTKLVVVAIGFTGEKKMPLHKIK